MTGGERSSLVPAFITLLLSLSPQTASGQPVKRSKTYALQTWSNLTCRAKGRFQDREYCGSAVIDAIVADEKSAIPILISQMTDARWIAEPVMDYWPRIRTGELAYFILQDLFLDDTWTKSTMPALFSESKCDAPAALCWGNFRKTHSLTVLQARWAQFWRANRNNITWDRKARCFRLSTPKPETEKR